MSPRPPDPAGLAHELGHSVRNGITQLRAATRAQLQVRVERGEFALAMLSPKFNEERYLTQRYQVELAKLKRRYYRVSHEVLSPEQAISFWLRREIDGTGRLLWGGLIRLMTSLDPIYLRSIADRDRD